MNRRYIALLFLLASFAAAPAMAAATNTPARQPQSADEKAVKFDRVGTLEKFDAETGEAMISGQKFNTEPGVTKAFGVDGRALDVEALKAGGLVGVRLVQGKTGTPVIVELKQLEMAKP